MKITVYRPNQIGGCITEIESKTGTRIIIDIGSNLRNTESEEVYVKELTRGCAGVFITHYHGDHVGEFPDVDENVPKYMGEMAHKIFLNLRERLRDKNIERIRNFTTFHAGQKIPVGDSDDMFVTPYRVDHSAYDSYMFLIECEGKKILHSGDFRTHGWTGKGVCGLLRSYVKKVDVLICEGTMLSNERENDKVYAEKDLLRDAKDIMKNPRNKNVFVLCSSTNIDSIASFYQAALETEKVIVADKYQCSNLEIVTDNAKNDPIVSKLYDFGQRQVYTYSNKNNKLHDYMEDKGFCMFIRATPFFEEPLVRFADSEYNVLVYSMWEGYLKEEKHYADPNIIAFVNLAKEKGCRVENKHTSGHAYEEALIEVCGIIRPDVIFPIHSENPGRWEELAKNGKINSIVRRLKHGVGVDPMQIIEVETVFNLLDRWRGLPSYQLERRADIFFAYFLPEILMHSIKELKGEIITHDNIVPEFPFMKTGKSEEHRTKKVDYVVICSKAVYMIELKTDMNSLKRDQINDLKRVFNENKTSVINLLELIYEIRISPASNPKYKNLTKLLRSVPGVHNIDKLPIINKRTGWKPETAKDEIGKIGLKLPEIEVVYILPREPSPKKKEEISFAKVICFDKVIEAIKKSPKFDSELATRFVSSLSQWQEDPKKMTVKSLVFNLICVYSHIFLTK